MWHKCVVLVYRSLGAGSWRYRSEHRSRTLHEDELIRSSVSRIAAVEFLGILRLIFCLPLPLPALGIDLEPGAPSGTPAVVDEGAIAVPWHIVVSAKISWKT